MGERLPWREGEPTGDLDKETWLWTRNQSRHGGELRGGAAARVGLLTMGLAPSLRGETKLTRDVGHQPCVEIQRWSYVGQVMVMSREC